MGSPERLRVPQWETISESIEACAKREVLEEIGMTVKNARFTTLTNDFFYQNDKHYVTLFVVCDHEKGIPEIKEPNKCETWGWFFWNEFPDPKFLSLQNLMDQGFIPVGIKKAPSLKTMKSI